MAILSLLMKRCVFILLQIFSFCYISTANVGQTDIGTVIAHRAKESQKYIGSPSICILPDGAYIASHDEFGPKSSEYQSAQTFIYKSEDKGVTWDRISRIDGQFWSNLFVMNGDLYIMGTNKHHGNFIIRKSSDGGKTWTIPYDNKTGLILEGEYHTAPVPVLIHKGRIWRALEYATSKTTKWGDRYSPMVISASIKSDLLDRDSWTVSNHLMRECFDADDNIRAFLEGNIVLSSSGDLVNLLRVNTYSPSDEVAAVVRVDRSGKRVSFNGEYINMPGAAKKFSVRFDGGTSKYLSIVSYDDGSHPDMLSSKIRNNLVLISSDDMLEWTIEKQLLYNSDVVHYGYQYVDWLIDGEDIIFVCRTASEDKDGMAKNNHDANYLTFHRIKNYKQLLHN